MATIAANGGPRFPKQNYYLGPFKGSNGAFYVILLTNDELAGACLKANDPTDTGDWSVQDKDMSPRGDDTILSAAARLSPDRKRIGVVTTQSNGSVHWSEFIIEDPDTTKNDKWRNLNPGDPFDVTKNVNGANELPDASVHACDCVWRSDGRRIVVYQGFREDLPGGPFDRIHLAHSSDGAVWEEEDRGILVSPNDAVDYRACRVALDGSRNTTILFRGSDDKLYQSVFDIDNNLLLEARDTGGRVSSAATFAISPCVWIDRTGTDRWKALYASADNDLQQIVYDSGADPTSFVTGVVVSAEAPGPGSISVDDGTVHGLGTRQGGNKVFMTDDGGGDLVWSALTAVLVEMENVTADAISTNIYERGGNTVLAYVYDDGGTVKYGEVVL